MYNLNKFMGGGYYDRDVGVASSSGGYSAAADTILSGNSKIHKNMDPKRWSTVKLETDAAHPIIFALDVTGSMGDWTKVSSCTIRLFTTNYPCSTARS